MLQSFPRSHEFHTHCDTSQIHVGRMREFSGFTSIVLLSENQKLLISWFAGSRPGRRPTFLARASKVGKRSTPRCASWDLLLRLGFSGIDMIPARAVLTRHPCLDSTTTAVPAVVPGLHHAAAGWSRRGPRFFFSMLAASKENGGRESIES